MGTMQKVSILFIFALVTAILAVTEVQEIGNDDSSSGASVSLDADDSAEFDNDVDNVGEENTETYRRTAQKQRGRGAGRGSFLRTIGSFVMQASQGLGRNEEEDELGEGEGDTETYRRTAQKKRGRGAGRGSFLRTTGSFVLQAS